MQSKQENTDITSGSESNSCRLMAVDDEPDITFTLKKVLEQRGFPLNVFNNPQTALINFKPDYYDLILLEVMMPQMNGFELYQEIKKKDKNVKTCFVTAYEFYYESLKQKYPKLDVGCYIRKPVDMNYLVNKIEKELACDRN
jgi:DNA-binding response OmpR family regulator